MPHPKMKKEAEKKVEWKPFKNPKKVKFLDTDLAKTLLRNWIIDRSVSNAGLISLGLVRLTNKFIREVEELYLSDELQGRYVSLPSRSKQ